MSIFQNNTHWDGIHVEWQVLNCYIPKVCRISVLDGGVHSCISMKTWMLGTISKKGHAGVSRYTRKVTAIKHTTSQGDSCCDVCVGRHIQV